MFCKVKALEEEKVMYLFVPLYLCDQEEFVEQEQIHINQLRVFW